MATRKEKNVYAVYVKTEYRRDFIAITNSRDYAVRIARQVFFDEYDNYLEDMQEFCMNKEDDGIILKFYATINNGTTDDYYIETFTINQFIR